MDFSTLPVLSMTQATIFQGENPVLSEVNFSVEQHEFVFLIGRTGSGKSSLLKTLYADLPLQTGLAEVVGYSLSQIKNKEVPFLRRKIGIIFQDFELFADRSIADNLTFVMKATGWKDVKLMDDKIADVLDKVGLKTKGFKMPFELSGGEQQRVDIARALLNSPKLILADEPTGNLDPETSDEIMQLLFHICNDFNTTVIMATHDYMVINKFKARTVKTEMGKVWDNASVSV